MIQKGRRHITITSPPMHRKPAEKTDTISNVLSALQLQRICDEGSMCSLHH
jgi:hypothetical protein